MTKLNAWILAARPKTLTASLVPIIATTSLAHSLGFAIRWWVVGLALLSSFCIQIGTNFVNDAMDFKKGADNEARLGPTRVTQQGYFSFRQVMIFASIFFLLAAVFGVPLVVVGGYPIVAIGIVSIAMGYAYTSGPLPLAYHGLGDLFVILFFGLVAVGGLFYLLTGGYDLNAVILGLQIGFLSCVLIAVNNLRDIENDRKVNKKTLAVRLGLTGGRIWIAFLLAAPYLAGYYWLYERKWWAYLVPLLCFPLALKIGKKVFKTEPSSEYNQFLAQASVLSLLFSLSLAVGFQIK